MEFLHGQGDSGLDPLHDSEGNLGYEPLPPAIERAARQREAQACVLWAHLLQDQILPQIGQLSLDDHPAIGPHSVLIDCAAGQAAPAIRYLGYKLAGVPQTLLLSCLADHALPIQAELGPLGFAAEFADAAGRGGHIHGIVLPFASHSQGAKVDHIWAVITQTERADDTTTAALHSELAGLRWVA
jgi:hypothetical protein